SSLLRPSASFPGSPAPCCRRACARPKRSAEQTMAEQAGEKSEKPSAKRLKDARERGQVAVSKDVSMALGSLAATGVLVAGGSFLLHRLTATITDGLSRLGDAPLREMKAEDLVSLVMSGGALIAL